MIPAASKRIRRDGQRERNPALVPVAAQRAPGPAAGVPALAQAGVREGELGVDPRGTPAAAGQLRMVREHPAKRISFGFPRQRIMRGGAPDDPDQRLVDVHDGLAAGGPQRQIPVLVLAARDGLVDQADAGHQGVAPRQVGGGMDHYHARAEQIPMGHFGLAGQPRMPAARVVDRDAAARELGAGPGAERPDLGPELAGQPFVVVVAEGDQVGI
jgi:hypothetical protein